MQLSIGGQWAVAQSGRAEEVTSPFDGEVAGSVPMAGMADIDAALTAAVGGVTVWRNTPGHEWMRIRNNGLNIGRSATDGENLTQRQSHDADADWQQRAARRSR